MREELAKWRGVREHLEVKLQNPSLSELGRKASLSQLAQVEARENSLYGNYFDEATFSVSDDLGHAARHAWDRAQSFDKAHVAQRGAWKGIDVAPIKLTSGRLLDTTPRHFSPQAFGNNLLELDQSTLEHVYGIKGAAQISNLADRLSQMDPVKTQGVMGKIFDAAQKGPKGIGKLGFLESASAFVGRVTRSPEAMQALVDGIASSEKPAITAQRILSVLHPGEEDDLDKKTRQAIAEIEEMEKRWRK